MKCKYKDSCRFYQETSEVCNCNQFKADGEPYCGRFRELENEK
jgi:hypothetical protein